MDIPLCFSEYVYGEILDQIIFLIAQEPSLSTPLIHFHKAYVAEVGEGCSVYLI